MTDEEREQVVELLRCAADRGFQSRGLLLTAAAAIDDQMDDTVIETCRRAWNAAWEEGMSDEEALLEAAQRVEEGSWS